MVDVKSLCHLTILLPTLCFMLVKCSLEPTDQFNDNPLDTKQDALTVHKRPSFFVGSRYGRSGSSASSSAGSSLYATSKTRRLNVVPRNDRFFLSSRYGKRAGMTLQNIENNNDDAILAPLLQSTPYEQALISEISSGTQLSNKPNSNSNNLQQLNDELNVVNTNHGQQSPQPYAYMSCIYTGLQNFYRCNSIDSMFHFKNAVINDDDSEVLSTDTTSAAVNDDDNDNNNDDDDDVDLDNDVNINVKK